MLNLFRAEWLKLNGNRWAAGFLIWIFPVGFVGVFMMLGVIAALTNSSAAQNGFPMNGVQQAIGAWALPSNFLGQIFLLALAANVFAGESAWNTWKNIVPITTRTRLIVIKYVTVLVMAFIGFTLTAIVALIGVPIVTAISGSTLTPEVTGETVQAFLEDYVIAMALGMLSIVFTTAYAAIAGLFARSVLVSVIVGVVVLLFEQISLALALISSYWLDAIWPLQVYQFLPSYNFSNVSYWIQSGAGWEIMRGDGPPIEALSQSASLVILAVWVAALFSLSLWLFRSRDVA